MPDTGSAKILIVDDDVGLLRLVEKGLKREGFSTGTAHSGCEALAWLQVNRADLMLVDLKLQDLEAQTLVEQLSAAGREVPFVIITGQGDERVAVDMMRRGALDYLVKDVRFIEFVPTVVRRALAQIEKDRRLAFAEKQARLMETIVEQSHSAVMITSREGPDPAILYVNPAFVELCGCPVPWLINRKLSELEALTGPWEPLRRVLATGRPFIGEFELHSSKGRHLTADCTITGVRDHSGMDMHWVALLRDVTERKQLQREILEISDKEQRRIGHDLHDGLGQQLTALEFFTTGLKEEVKTKAPSLTEPLKTIGEHLRAAIRQVRGIATGLSPVALHGDGLVSALRKLAETTSAMAGVDCAFKVKTHVVFEDSGVATQFYRIAQECVSNALKHGQAKKIRITLERPDDRLKLTVQDNGCGFSATAGKPPGIGLRAMNYRADLIGATLEIESSPGKGARVTCSIPKPK